MEFKRASWIANSNIYEVNTRQYTTPGTFHEFAKALPRLKDMGVEVLWMMPVHPIGKINRKGTLGSYYSIADFNAINPEFGTKADFRDLVDRAHELDMKVIMDWVANHAAWDNVWTKDHPGYFVRDAEGLFVAPYDWTDVIQIDHSNTDQQWAMIKAMQYWVNEFDIDGFRADLAHLTPLDFWRKARTAIEPLKKDLFWLAETEEIAYHEVFDASFTWEWMHATERFYKENTGLNSLYEVLAKYNAAFPETALRMYFTSNHDENSWNGTGEEKYGELWKALTVFNMTWNGIPLVYSGEEIPNRRRLKFFEKDPIDWTGAISNHEFYKTLLGLRKSNKALRGIDSAAGTFHILIAGGDKVMAYLRKHEEAEVLVLLNLSSQATGFIIKDRLVNGCFVNVFDKTETVLTDQAFVKMKGWEYLVLEKK